jgi:Domain of unknown function (DUF4382)
MLSLSKRSLLSLGTLLVTVVCLSSLPVLAAQADQGVLEIQIKDHREAIDDFVRLNVVIDKILVSPKPGLKFWQTGWKDLSAAADTVDLTKYLNKRTARVFRSSIAAGSFDAFHLKLKNIDAVLKKNQRSTPVKNSIPPVQVSFEVPANGETVLVIDLVVTDFSDHPPRGYELGIKGYEIYSNGKLTAKIPPG